MDDNIVLKTSIEVARIRRVSRILTHLFEDISRCIKPGVPVYELVSFAIDLIHKNGAESAIMGFKGFPAPICISVNNVAAHGIPGDYVIQDGDIVTVDCAIHKEGWFSDAAWTYIAGDSDPTRTRLVKSAWQCMKAGIEAARALNRLGDIGAAVEDCASKYGTTVLKGFTGHGIGKKLHEDPTVPFFGEPGTGLPVVPGMVLTVEPIVILGEGDIKTLLDNWTIVTENGELAAHFEQTIAVFGHETETLTIAKDILKNYPEYPPY